MRPPFHAPSAVPHYLQPRKKYHFQQKRVSNLQHRDSNTFHLPTWFAIPLSNPLSFFYIHFIMLEKRGWGRRQIFCSRHLRTINTEQKYPQGGQEFLEYSFHHMWELCWREEEEEWIIKCPKGAVGMDYRDEKGYIPIPLNIFWLVQCIYKNRLSQARGGHSFSVAHIYLAQEEMQASFIPTT